LRKQKFGYNKNPSLIAERRKEMRIFRKKKKNIKDVKMRKKTLTFI